MNKKYLTIYSKRKNKLNWEFSSIYSIKKDEKSPYHKLYKLFHSKLDKMWTKKVAGKMAAVLEDDGDGITVRFKNKKIRLDYSEYQELQLLINEANLDSGWEDKVERTEVIK